MAGVTTAADMELEILSNCPNKLAVLYFFSKYLLNFKNRNSDATEILSGVSESCE